MQGADAWVRVFGRGSFQVSPALKKFAVGAIERRCRRVILDMRECLGMDSTFLGVLAGLALQLRKREGELVLVNADSKNCALVETLGLSRLIRQVSDSALVGPAAPRDLTALDTAADKRTTAETMLAAHETIVAEAPQNALQFKDVLMYLQEEVKRAASPPKSG